MTIRAYIADDEMLARDRIRTLLEKHADIELAGEAGDGEQAIAGLRDLKPDLLFLDVQMPGRDGFAVLRALGDATLPVTIFVTAYDRYAVEAFTACALDFLLKPFNRARFEQALARAKTTLRDRELRADLRRRVTEVISEARGGRFSSRIVVKVDGKHVFLPVDELRWVQAEGDYARLHLAKRTYLIRERMNTLEAKLDPERFLRIHRSTIVNLEHIREAHPGVGGDYIVRLDDDTDLTVSRSYRASVQKFLDQAL